MLEAVVSNNLQASTGPEIVIFKRFRSKWPALGKSNFCTASDEVPDFSDDIILYATNQLEQFQPQDDYRELLELTIVFLGGHVKNFTFKTPAGLRRARWMAKAIYSLKIWMFKGQFQLTPTDESGLKAICMFTVCIYIKVWFTAGVALSAPRIHLQLLKDLNRYQDKNHVTANAALRKILGHLWYLSEELVALAFFDDQVPNETKRKMVSALQNSVAKEPVKRPTLDISLISVKKLEDFVTSNTLRFFAIIGLPRNFLDEDIEKWEQNEEFIAAKTKVNNMKVVNDVAERGVALMEEYNNLITNDEQQKQYVLQVVSAYRKTYPDRKKSTLMK